MDVLIFYKKGTNREAVFGFFWYNTFMSAVEKMSHWRINFLPRRRLSAEAVFSLAIFFLFLSFAVLAALLSPALWAEWWPVFFALSVLLICRFRMERYFYVFSALVFLRGWTIVLENFSWARGLPWLSGLDAPVADFAFVIFAFVFLGFFIWKRKKIDWQKFWAGKKVFFIVAGAFTPFVLSAALSAIFSPEGGANWQYIFRFPVFAFLAFVAFPVLVLNRASALIGAARVLFFVGLATALFGFSSVFFVNQTEWVRATPYAVLGFAPFGDNHNLLGEIFVAVLPLALYFVIAGREKNQGKPIYLAGLFIMLLAAFFTLSRAAWLSMLVQGTILFYFYRKNIVTWLKGRNQIWLALIGLLFLPIFAYMIFFLNSEISRGSTSSRMAMTEFVLAYFTRTPWLGQGPGTFLPLLGETLIWMQEYGDPLEAHGWPQKILLEQGLMGVFTFVLFLIVLFGVLWRAQKNGGNRFLARVLLVSAAGAVFFQFFNTSYYSGAMWFPIGLAVAAAGLKDGD